MKHCIFVILPAVLAIFPLISNAQDSNELSQFIDERNDQYSDNLEKYFADWLVNQYPERAEKEWHRSYESISAFLASVEPNRRAWFEVLNPPDLPVTGALERKAHPALSDIGAEWLTLPMGPVKAEGILALPKEGQAPYPLVIAQHGIGSTPERVFGLLDDGDNYHGYGRALLDEGYAVYAPFNLRSVEKRNRIERLARLADTTLPGLELIRMQSMLTEILKDERIDGERVGMWGLSLGGMATMFWVPLEPRIKVAIPAAWFNHRRNKMVIPDERYSCFLETTEEHAFFRGWLTQFTDYDVVSLICPRPLMIQAGKKDSIAWWPQIEEEFAASKVHYDKLGMGDRIELDLHDGGHEVRVETGIRFLNKWLKKK